MQHSFLLLMAVCALTSALPQNRVSVAVKKEVSSTTVKPRSKMIEIESTEELTQKVSAAGDKLVVLFFMANFCSYSRRAVPIVENIANTMDDIVVLKVNTWKAINIEEYNVTVVPTFVFLKNSKKLAVIEGFGEDGLKETIQKLK